MFSKILDTGQKSKVIFGPVQNGLDPSKKCFGHVEGKRNQNSDTYRYLQYL